MSEVKNEGSLLGQAWLVLCLSIIFGGSLAGIEMGLKETIKAKQKAETFSQIKNLVPGAVADTSEESVVGGVKVIKAMDKSGGLKGWVLNAAGAGFADIIKVLIGVNADATLITGIYVLDQKETPGLGDFITDEGKFRHWYRKQPTKSPLAVSKGNPKPETGLIKALTGATVSSQAVTTIVNLRIKNFRAELFALNKGVE